MKIYQYRVSSNLVQYTWEYSVHAELPSKKKKNMNRTWNNAPMRGRKSFLISGEIKLTIDYDR
jgi:hypothetical protein